MTHYRWLRALAGFGGLGMRLNSNDTLYCCLPLYHNNALTVALSAVLNGGCDAGAGQVVLGVEVLGRRDPLRRHRVRLHRRDLRLSAQPAGEGHRPQAQGAGDRGQRPAPGDLGRVHRAVRHRPGVRVLRRQRGQHRVRQRAERRQDAPASARRRWRSSSTTTRPATRSAATTAGSARSRPASPGCCSRRSAASSRSTATPTRRQSEKKLVRDAFKEGDVWFNTGDLMRSQGFGHAAFTDRLGDTFRWKGENVATTEVEAAVSTDPQVEEATVFGVEVPGTGGRAGMVAIQLKEGQEFDGKALAKAAYDTSAVLRRAAVRPGRQGAGAHLDVQEPEGGSAQGGLRRQLGRGRRGRRQSRTRSTCCPAATRATSSSTTSTSPR